MSTVGDKRSEDDYELESSIDDGIETIAHMEPTKTEQNRVLRKLDIVIMPLMATAVLLQMLDKTTTNMAVLMNFLEDTHINATTEYPWLGSAFYFGYLAATPLQGVFMQRLPLAKYLSIMIMLWGMILTCHKVCHSFHEFVAARFFQGFCEASIFPSLILLTGRFYTRHEQVSRMVLWFSMNAMAEMVGGAVAYGILKHPPTIMKMWQEQFLIFGVITVAFGILCFVCLPSSPESTYYLSQKERAIAILRVAKNQSGIKDKHFKWNQFWEAFKDIRIYLFFLGYISITIVNGGVTNFSSQIIQSFNYDRPRSALLNISVGGSEFIAYWLGAFIFELTDRRIVTIMFGLIFSLIGTIMMIAIPEVKNSSRMAGLCLTYFYNVAMPLFYSWQSGSVAGATKRIIFSVVLQLAHSGGNIIGPQTYQGANSQFTAAKVVMIVMIGSAIFFSMFLFIIHLRWNKKKEQEVQPQFKSYSEQLRTELSDLTDWERVTYRYTY